MPSLIQTLLLGAALPLADFALGQTIEVGGETVGMCLSQPSSLGASFRQLTLHSRGQ